MMQKNIPRPLGQTVEPSEVAKFAALADSWWDPEGPFRPLHQLNPVRLAYIRDRLCARTGRAAEAPQPLRGLKLLDIGCGGGLLSEPMARMGAEVTGLDATERSIRAAAHHARQMELDIDYRFSTVEELAATGAAFDVVLNMEVVEHVADRAAFLAASAALVRPGGCMFLSTLNRTARSFLLAVVGAEYVLRWLPRGTHDWRKFPKPSELAGWLRPHGMTLAELTGVAFHPLRAEWRLAPRDLSVNYMALAEKPA